MRLHAACYVIWLFIVSLIHPAPHSNKCLDQTSFFGVVVVLLQHNAVRGLSLNLFEMFTCSSINNIYFYCFIVKTCLKSYDYYYVALSIVLCYISRLFILIIYIISYSADKLRPVCGRTGGQTQTTTIHFSKCVQGQKGACSDHTQM